MKSMRCSRDYQRKKVDLMAQRLAQKTDELSNALDRVADLAHCNKSLAKAAFQLEDDAKKSADLLSKRTERFVVFCDRKDDEIRRIEVQAENRVKVLEKRHGLAIRKMESEFYRNRRQHNKIVLELESNVEHLKNINE